MPLLVVAIAVFWAADLEVAHESRFLLLALNFLFSTLVSVFIAHLVGRSFLLRGSPGLLLLGCGVVVWGLAGFVATVAGLISEGGQHYTNVVVTIHNTCVALSGLCHVAGAALLRRPRRAAQATELWLPVGYVLSLAAVGLLAFAAVHGWLPVFFVQGQGGTPPRQLVVGTAVAAFAVAAGLLGTERRRSPFRYWYALALALVAAGLLGVLIQSTFGGLVGWAGRVGQYLGGVYMLIAALASLRESGAWGLPLETALRESEERFRVLAAATFEGIAITAQGRFFDANEQLLRMLGYRRDELIGMEVAALLLPEDRERVLGNMLAGYEAHVEHPLVRKDGTQIIVESHGRTLDYQGRRVRLTAIRDVTARTQAEEALRQSEARYRRVVEHVSDALISDDASGRIVFANDRFLELFGFERAEVGALQIEDYAAPEYRQELRARHERRMRGEAVPTHFEYGAMRRDGRRLWLEVDVAALVDEDGRITGTQSAIRDITARKQAEETLRASDERYRALFEGMTEGFALHEIICDAEGTPCDYRFLDVNPAFERLTGLKQADVIGRTLFQVLPDEDPKWVRVFGRVALTGEPAQLDDYSAALHRHYDVYAYRPAPGQFAVLFVDITARKEAERELQASQALLQAVIDGCPDPIFLKDRESRIVLANPATLAVIGKPAEQVIGHDDRAHYSDPAVGAAIIANDCRIMDLGHGETVEEVGLTPTGYRVFLSNKTPWRDANGRVIGLIGIARDITDRKQMEESLRQTRDYLDNLFNYANAPIIVWDPRYRITRFNRAFEHLTGRKAEDVLGQEIGILFPAPVRHAALAHIRRTSSGGERWEAIEIPIQHADGSVRTVLWNSANVLGEDGRTVVATIAQGQDITARKRLEQERAELLASERAARSEAERASRMKDEFIATLSHELRNPLNAILGWAQLLKRPTHTESDITEGISIIESSGRALADMVSDLLDLSRITSGKLRLDLRPADPRAVVLAAVEAVRPAAQEKGLSVTVTQDDDAGGVHADPGRLQQIIWNLLSNAVKFTDSGGQVRVGTRRSGDRLEISVADTGMGIDPEFLPHVFERFRQEDATTTRRYGGLGLGLSIVRSLVEMHGGSVRADSPGRGRGATFTVDLPRLESVAVAPPGALEPATLDCDSISLGGITVLAIDDEPDSREMIKRVLEERGAAVCTADGAAAALHLLERVRPDVLISDIGMPEVDGYELLRRVRALGPDRGGATPALALTAYAGLEDRQRAMVCGYQAHVAKPVEVAQLVALVAALVGRIAYVSPGAQRPIAAEAG